jgi:hypothetical protein
MDAGRQSTSKRAELATCSFCHMNYGKPALNVGNLQSIVAAKEHVLFRAESLCPDRKETAKHAFQLRR